MRRTSSIWRAPMKIRRPANHRRPRGASNKIPQALLCLAIGLFGCEPAQQSPPPPVVAIEIPAPPPVEVATTTDPGGEACDGSRAFSEAAGQNAISLATLVWSPFGREELGWEIYWPRIAEELDTTCGPTSAGFAAALARWQSRKGVIADGVLRPSDFTAMNNAWYRERPFVALNGSGVCPEPPPLTAMEAAKPEESYGSRPMLVRTRALEAYRRMVEAARQEVPELAAQPDMLKIFSAYRDPAQNSLRCALEGDCGGAERANCSAHRTGLAIDIIMGAAPGHRVDSSADPNRLHMSRTLAYRWLVANGRRFGFFNYVFEPWHWEWTGEPI